MLAHVDRSGFITTPVQGRSDDVIWVLRGPPKQAYDCSRVGVGDLIANKGVVIGLYVYLL